MTDQLMTHHELNDRQFFEAVLANWEYTLASAYRVALDETGDDDEALNVLLSALDTCYEVDEAPPAAHTLVGAMSFDAPVLSRVAS